MLCVKIIFLNKGDVKMTNEIQAAANVLAPGMTVSLGGGRHMQALAHAIADAELDVTLCSPAVPTRAAITALGLRLVDLPEHVDWAFDGCDSVDRRRHALKSNGGIHTFEKLYADIADQYVLVAPPERVVDRLSPAVPLTLEVVPPAVWQVVRAVSDLGYVATQRTTGTVTTTPLGNSLVDITADDWGNIERLDNAVRAMNGVVGTSYFDHQVTDILTTDAAGVAVWLK